MVVVWFNEVSTKRMNLKDGLKERYIRNVFKIILK